MNDIPVAEIVIENGRTPAEWDSTYTDDEYIDEEACVVYSCDGCSAEWSIPDGRYAIIKIGETVTLSPEAEEAIKRSLQDLEEGRVYDHLPRRDSNE